MEGGRGLGVGEHLKHYYKFNCCETSKRIHISWLNSVWKNDPTDSYWFLWFQGIFSVDVNRTPPSTYTVTGLTSHGFQNDLHPFTDLSRNTQSEKETSFIEKGFRSLILSSTSLEMASPCLNLVFLKDTETKCINLFSTVNSKLTLPFQLRPVTEYELFVFRGKEIQTCCFKIEAIAHCSFISCKAYHHPYWQWNWF